MGSISKWIEYVGYFIGWNYPKGRGREREKSEKKKNLIRAINKVYILKREIFVEYPLRLDLSGFDTKSNMHLSGRRR